jgi:hypothetical protein
MKMLETNSQTSMCKNLKEGESATVCRNAVVNAILAKNGATGNPVIEKCLDMLIGGNKNIEFDKMIEGLGKPPFYTNNTWIKKLGLLLKRGKRRTKISIDHRSGQ